MMQYIAYVKTDPKENIEVIQDLRTRLKGQNIILHTTDKEWHKIEHLDQTPFLYYKNPYIRFDNERMLLEFHSNQNFPYIKLCGDKFGVIACIKNIEKKQPLSFPFEVKQPTWFYEPKRKSLPILLANYRRPMYLKLTLNSILHNVKDIGDQELYVVSSDPDLETLEILHQLPENVNIVVSEENLGRAISNFGAKFFGLDKFIHFETDGILPETTSYLLPYWTKQLDYRSETADVVAFRVSDENKPLHHHLHFYDTKELIFNKGIWNYFIPKKNDFPPITGLGMVIDSKKIYSSFQEGTYAKNDWGIYFSANSVCVINIPIYHLGNNQTMDYGTRNESPLSVNKFQKGVNLRTKESKVIDLAKAYEKS